MRGLIGIAVIVGLIALGWAKPFREWVYGPPPPVPPPLIEKVRTVEAKPQAAAKPAPGTWMWDKERKTALDKGNYNRDYNVTRSPDIYSTSPTRVDHNGNRYWVDQYGGYHYY